MSKSGPVFKDSNRIEILSQGDKIFLTHKWSQEKKEVTLITINEKFVVIAWPMCGNYDVNINTGELKPTGHKKKGAMLWTLSKDDMEKIRNTVEVAKLDLHERFKKNKK